MKSFKIYNKNCSAKIILQLIHTQYSKSCVFFVFLFFANFFVQIKLNFWGAADILNYESKVYCNSTHNTRREDLYRHDFSLNMEVRASLQRQCIGSRSNPIWLAQHHTFSCSRRPLQRQSSQAERKADCRVWRELLEP